MGKMIFIFVFLSMSALVYAENPAWVTVDNLNRRTCPSSSCGIVGVLKYREKAIIFEENNSWSRISKYYDAACNNGVSLFVDSGNNKCNLRNGISNGTFAEWVSSKYLSTNRPASPAANASGNYALIKGSDDYRIYKEAFVKAASGLISSGKCTENDFRQTGGWVKSSNYRSKPIYFAYCGGMRLQNKIYLNAATGAIMR